MTTRHGTASVFLFDHRDGCWQLGLVWHPRFERWMIPGGHTEPDENPAQTAVKEVLEETGYATRLLSVNAIPMPDGVPEPAVMLPVWIIEEDVPPEGHRIAEPHIHVDSLYVAVLRDSDAEPARAVHDFTWCPLDQLAARELFPTTEILARVLFERIDDLVASQPAVL